MPYKFYVKDCPENLAVHDWIAGQSDIYKYIDEMAPRSTNKKILSFKHPNIDISKIPAGKYLVTIVNGKTYTTPQKLIIF